MKQIQNAIEIFEKNTLVYRTCLITGGIIISQKIIQSAIYFWRHFSPSLDINKRYGEGSWAVVTGGADGIGRCFAHSLARRGFNLVLIDINLSKLDQTEKEIIQINDEIMVQIIKFDFSDAMIKDTFQQIEDSISGLDVSLLINNVGMANNASQYQNWDQDILKKLLVVNILSQVMMTQMLLPRLLSRQTHKSGIISMSSCTGLYTNPYTITYAGSKAFNRAFSTTLQAQYSKQNQIDFLYATPFGVSTAMMSHRQGPQMSEPDEVAENILGRLGKSNNTYGSLLHYQQGWMINFLQTFFRAKYDSTMIRMGNLFLQMTQDRLNKA